MFGSCIVCLLMWLWNNFKIFNKGSLNPLMSTENAELKSLRRRINIFYRRKRRYVDKEKEYQCPNRRHFVIRKRNPLTWAKAKGGRAHGNGSQGSYENGTGLIGTRKLLVSLSICSDGLSTLLLSAHLLFSLCIVSGHLIVIFTQVHLSQKEEFNIWVRKYLIERRIQEYRQALRETGAINYKSHPQLKCSFCLLLVRVSLFLCYYLCFCSPGLHIHSYSPHLFLDGLCFLYIHVTKPQLFLYTTCQFKHPMEIFESVNGKSIFPGEVIWLAQIGSGDYLVQSDSGC